MNEQVAGERVWEERKWFSEGVNNEKGGEGRLEY